MSETKTSVFETSPESLALADRLMHGPRVEQVCDGYRRTKWQDKDLGAVCLLHQYDYENKPDQESPTLSTPQYAPFFVMQLTFPHPDTESRREAYAQIRLGAKETAITRLDPHPWDYTYIAQHLMQDVLYNRVAELGDSVPPVHQIDMPDTLAS